MIQHALKKEAFVIISSLVKSKSVERKKYNGWLQQQHRFKKV